MRSGTWCLTSGSTSWIKQGTRTVKDRIKTETFGCKDLFLWLWIDPDPGTMPNSRGKKPLHSSCINSCVMSEGYRHGEFVWCGWKLTLCDWIPHCVFHVSVRRREGHTSLFMDGLMNRPPGHRPRGPLIPRAPIWSDGSLFIAKINH